MKFANGFIIIFSLGNSCKPFQMTFSKRQQNVWQNNMTTETLNKSFLYNEFRLKNKSSEETEKCFREVGCSFSPVSLDKSLAWKMEKFVQAKEERGTDNHLVSSKGRTNSKDSFSFNFTFFKHSHWNHQLCSFSIFIICITYKLFSCFKMLIHYRSYAWRLYILIQKIQ